jgi:asparagine synthase (glutamine-hydrolysing)
MSAGFYLKWDRQTGELVSSAGNVAIFDDIVVGHSGRLHDRAELAACLNLSADSEIALLLAAAYRRWGADFAAQVNGEYVASIVDRKCRQLTIASDVLGLWQAYIYELPGAIEVGSDLAMFAPYKLDLSNEYFEHYLTTGHLMSAMTPYVGIERTVPGVAEIFENSSHESRQVWSVSTLSERQYISDQ